MGFFVYFFVWAGNVKCGTQWLCLILRLRHLKTVVKQKVRQKDCRWFQSLCVGEWVLCAWLLFLWGCLVGQSQSVSLATRSVEYEWSLSQVV